MNGAPRGLDGRSARPVVTYGFLALCVVATVLSLLAPSLYGGFGGIEPRQYPWQVFTAVLEHGWPGFHGSIHLALNTFLILEAGRPCERLLGRRRFTVLSLAAASANAVVQVFTEGVNGSSLVIWAWGPPLFMAVRNAPAGGMGRERAVAVLIVMYVVVTPVMPMMPYVLGWRGNLLVAYGSANRYHAVATAVGVAGAFWWRPMIRSRVKAITA